MGSERTLVLNSNYQVIGIVPWSRAISLIYEDIAETLCEWNNDVKREIAYDREVSNNDRKYVYKIPAIIVLKNNNVLPKHRTVKFSKVNVFYRDDFTCQYCGYKGDHVTTTKSKRMTIDHILPVSKGGKTSFENCVAACAECNFKKSNSFLHEVGMKLLRKPVVPSVSTLLRRKLNRKKIHQSWIQYLGTSEIMI